MCEIVQGFVNEGKAEGKAELIKKCWMPIW